MGHVSLYSLALLSFCLLANAEWTSETSVLESSETEATSESTTTGSAAFNYQREYIPPCYVERSKVAELMIRMNQTVQIFNRKDEYLECGNTMKIVEVEAGVEMCSDDQILWIQKELNEVAGRLFQLAIRVEEPLKDEIVDLDWRKFRLIDEMKALHIFYGHSPCDSSSIVLYPFEPLIEYVEYNLEQVLVLFQNRRTIRPLAPIIPTTTTQRPRPMKTSIPDPTPADFLNPNKTFQELTAMARLNPAAMNTALPKIISARYNGSNATFEDITGFVADLPTVENRVFGFSALYDKMQGQDKLPPLPQLIHLSENVKWLNKSASLISSFIGTAAWFKLSNVVHGQLSPLIHIGGKASCDIFSVPYQRQLVIYDPIGYPESAYVRQDTNVTSQFIIYPRVESDQVVFRISRSNEQVYASDNNPNTNNTIYQAKQSERFLLDSTSPPADAELDWKIVPNKDKQGTFRILTAKYDDFMFAHESATGWSGGYRRVLLGKKSFPKHDHVPDADLWTLNCVIFIA